ncbi:MAG: Alginate biosynthesis protein AlgA [Smithella sp. PtaU1.Bin162]|nr:MAG: Alginate biosynthesis protein AlgA [Smithella sp. PtaU1.Bin162]
MNEITDCKYPLIPTILCGGAGTRLWPLSRDGYPKQFLPLSGVAEETMLQGTIRRLDGFAFPDAGPLLSPIVVCNEDHRFLVAEQLQETGSGGSIILEPVGRNTAPALAIAAINAVRTNPDAVLLVMPADHIVEDRIAFQQAVMWGIAPALAGDIVTFGIVPHSPETGYGYIQADRSSPVAHRTFPILRFVEKPNRATADAFLAAGDYCWNSGMFLLKAGTWLKSLELLRPTMLSACRAAFERGSRDRDFYRLDGESFSACPADSIDYAVMEKLRDLGKIGIRGVMVLLSTGWSDVGTWDAVWQSREKNEHGNVISGDVITEDTKESLVISTSRLVSCLGLDRLAIIETPDAVLIAGMDKAQEVKRIAADLKDKGRREGIVHRKVFCPWGWYDTLAQGECFQVKHLVVSPGEILSMQFHRQRSEHWVVVSGVARVTRGEQSFPLEENQSIFIPANEKHRLENPGNVPIEIIEVQWGTYLGENDIVRLEDRYGRITAIQKK